MPSRSLEILRGVFPELSGLEDARPVTVCISAIYIQHQSVCRGVANRKSNGQKKAVSRRVFSIQVSCRKIESISTESRFQTDVIGTDQIS